MKRLFSLLFFTCFAYASQAQMTARVVRDSLFIPWELVYGQDDHIWFTQKNGYVCRMEPMSGRIDTVYYEQNTVVNGEGGMLGMALHPSFATDPYVYIAYQYTQNGYKERIVRYTYSNGQLGNPQILLDDITGASIHNGCRLTIVNDKLFITTGDAATTATAQNIQSLNGKTLRINLDGSIPPDNPFPNSPVWSWGHRNAQGMVYANGILYQSEHGPTTDDEINIVEKGRNYGWPNVMGYCNTPAEMAFCNDSNVVEPIQAWTPTIATSGMAYYNHSMFPSLQHSLLMTTLKNSKLYQLVLNASGDSIVTTNEVTGVSFGRLRDICISPEGKIYLSTSNSAASGSGNKVDRIIELHDPSVVNVSNFLRGRLSVRPNPATEFSEVFLNDFNSEAGFEYSLTDGAGRIVLSDKGVGNKIRFPMHQLSTGMYIITIRTQSGEFHRAKIMKQ